MVYFQILVYDLLMMFLRPMQLQYVSLIDHKTKLKYKNKQVFLPDVGFEPGIPSAVDKRAEQYANETGDHEACREAS